MIKPNKTWLMRAVPNKNRIYLLEDTSPDGRLTYFFIQIDPAKEKSFHTTLEENRTLNLTNFARIITSGYGKPPEDLLSKMREEFGTNC